MVEGFDPKYFHRVLSEFWLEYEQRGWLNKFWESLCQVMDSQYLELFHANFSKSLLYCPIYTRRLWLNYTFEESDWQENRHPHWHKHDSYLVAADRYDIPLSFEVTSNAMVFKNGILLEYSRDYLFSTSTEIQLSDQALIGDLFEIEFVDYEEDPENHSHKVWQEYLTSSKQNWTDSAGDVFSKHGPYDPSASNPIQVYVDGVRLAPSQYVESSSTLLTTLSPVAAGSQVIIQWINDTDDSIHNHLHSSVWYPSGSTEITSKPVNLSSGESESGYFKFNPSDDYDDETKRDLVWVGGLLQTKDETESITNADYRTQDDIIILKNPLAAEENIFASVYDPGQKYYVEIGDSVAMIPTLQDGIDEYDNQWNEYDDYLVKDGNLYSSIKFTDVWAFETYINDEIPYYNFGEPIDFYRENSEVYVGMLQALWRAYFNGPQIYITEEACKMLLNVPFITDSSRVISITDTGAVRKDYVMEFENGTSYELNYPLTPRFEEGDTVEAFDTLSEGVTIYDEVKYPDWYTKFPPILEFFDEFYYNEDDLPYSGCFDDGLFFDDGGRFDYFDYRYDPDSYQEIYKKRFYDVIKHFVFLVDIDISLIPDISFLDDVTLFLDNIKPAYTKYIIIATKNVDDEITVPGEVVEFEPTLELNDYHPAPFEDFSDGVVDDTVISELGTPPGSPTYGDKYLVATGAVGDWAGHDGEIALWNVSVWNYTSPVVGYTIYNSSIPGVFMYNGSAWVSAAGLEDIRNPYFDDGGYFDMEHSAHTETASPGQNTITLTENTYQDNWIVFIDWVAQTEGVDWDWHDDTTFQIDLATPLAGWEDIFVYRNDTASIPLDWRCCGDSVKFELYETVSEIAQYVFNS